MYGYDAPNQHLQRRPGTTGCPERGVRRHRLGGPCELGSHCRATGRRWSLRSLAAESRPPTQKTHPAPHSSRRQSGAHQAPMDRQSRTRGPCRAGARWDCATASTTADAGRRPSRRPAADLSSTTGSTRTRTGYGASKAVHSRATRLGPKPLKGKKTGGASPSK